GRVETDVLREGKLTRIDPGVRVIAEESPRRAFRLRRASSSVVCPGRPCSYNSGNVVLRPGTRRAPPWDSEEDGKMSQKPMADRPRHGGTFRNLFGFSFAWAALLSSTQATTAASPHPPR